MSASTIESATEGDGIAPVLTLGREDLGRPDAQEEARRMLETGGLVFLRDVGFELSEREREMISDNGRLMAGIRKRAKPKGKPTIFFDPARGRITRTRLGSHVRGDVEAMMGRFAEWALRTTRSVVPAWKPSLYQERVTFRPVLRGVKQGLHIDQSYGHPTNGQGMLRLFCNIDPGGRARVWQVGERFEPFVSRFLPRIRRQDPTLAERLVGALGLIGGRRTAYDHTVAEIRDVAMHDFEYQKTAPRRILEFPVGSSWLGITDLVVHGAVFGQNSLDQTFFLPDTARMDPSRSSLRILERLTGRALA